MKRKPADWQVERRQKRCYTDAKNEWNELFVERNRTDWQAVGEDRGDDALMQMNK